MQPAALSSSRALGRVMSQRVGVRSALTSSSSLLARGGGHDDGTVSPPFQRLPAPNKPFVEQAELVWEDPVAPEATIDFDAPHVPTSSGIKWWLGGFGFFFGLYQLAKLTKPAEKKRTLSRGDALPPEAHAALGGYMEAAREREEPVQVVR